MPPTNSPNETRPSTPPTSAFATSSSSLSSHPYLQQLQEAISTPVPDLASTLTTPEPRLDSYRRRTHSRTASEWDGPAQLLRDADELEARLREDEAYLARSSETRHRIQSEVERWQNERSRLRDILHTQQDRQSMLEEQNLRLREHRLRLRQEHQRLHDRSSRPTEQNSQPRSDFSRLQEEQENLNSLAGAIAEVGRENYTTGGSAPSRERLYDWAATRPRGNQEEGNEMSASGEADNGPRRELERALRNYRVARSAFRSGRQPGTDMGTVPTASALRAYWNEDPNDQSLPSANEDSANRPPFALSEFVEQHRLERQRRHLESGRRHNEHRARIEGQFDHHTITRNMARCPNAASEAFARVANTIRYLSALRRTNIQGGLELARYFGLDSLYECPDANTSSDLPMTVESLPEPQPSSWIQPGMTWHGLQSTDREPSRPALLASTLRRIRQRDYVGRAMARRGYTTNPYSQDAYSSLQPIPPEEADRYLMSFMQDNLSSRWRSDEPDHSQLRGSSASDLDPTPLIAQDTPSLADADHWPVTVTLHSVDWEAMTVSGTMRASQIPDHSSETEGKSMESFFQGEIIDFRNHTLLSDGSAFGYRIGGVEVDARYWARLGPFKREIGRATSSFSPVKKWDGKTKYVNWVGKDYDLMLSSEDRKRKENEAEDVMARCLGSTKWLREKVGGDWILMRWKEKCFADPIMPTSSTTDLKGTPSGDTASRPPPTSSEYPSASTTLLGDRAHAQWGLTISGFYYVALHRQTGRIDGLYYDPGSQPYQSLTMVPEGCRLPDEIEEPLYVQRRKTAQEEMQGAGLKKWFPAVEFR